MIANKRKGLISIAVVLLASISAATAWEMIAYRLPDPATADREGLMRWMVTRDLAAESPDVRARLVARLEEELRSGIDLTQVEDRIDEQQGEQFWQNVDVLLQNWFVREAERFAVQPSDNRSTYLNGRIDDVLAWDYVRELRRSLADDESTSGDTALMAKSLARIQPWIDGAEKPQARKMDDLLTALKGAIMFRYLTGSLPPVEPEL